MQENIGGVWLLWLCSTIQRERPVIQPQPDHIMIPANIQSHGFVRSLTQDNVSCGSTDGQDKLPLHFGFSHSRLGLAMSRASRQAHVQREDRAGQTGLSLGNSFHDSGKIGLS